ncbi:unnamed protein product [Gulo gulo]|uniref:Uncharacterized protein n=1 Tax=Gulo gulo TaxID=48420 RepID=A0A9X9LF09_GULGU|nr:unnamed protein product [Gulo gulo]
MGTSPRGSQLLDSEDRVAVAPPQMWDGAGLLEATETPLPERGTQSEPVTLSSGQSVLPTLESWSSSPSCPSGSPLLHRPQVSACWVCQHSCVAKCHVKL